MTIPLFTFHFQTTTQLTISSKYFIVARVRTVNTKVTVPLLFLPL